jgi:hypothetical protein
MRKNSSAVTIFVATILIGSGTAALAANLDMPPGPPNHVHSDTPPDPCRQAQIGSQTSGAGAGKIHSMPYMRKAGGERQEMRKAGGEQEGTLHGSRPNIHCLNPQPLPPG